MNANTTDNHERLLRIDEVVRRVAVSESTIRRRMEDDKSGFPAPVRVGARIIAWRASEIDAYLRNLPTRTKEI
ncbi:MAG: AlpA family phage regulatory protein [Mesorhizobium sp.]|nr:AlpA family phage regulatory protein [Mesorhizobium sp.]MBL8577731.1 AlpA family phage regulatory protein [Mesorhizobium sp.]